MQPNDTREFIELLTKLQTVYRKNGLKNTRQRELILRVLYTYPEHITPEKLHQEVSKAYPEENIGIATIYRTLSLLEKEGIAESISFGSNGKKYELSLKPHHDHMICNQCGAIIEFRNDELEHLQQVIAQNHHFHTTGHTLQIFGLCQECSPKA